MGSKQRVTIALDRDMVQEIDRVSKEKKASRSHIIEGAIQLWRKRQLEKDLIEGYLHMSKENAMTAETNLAAGEEALP
jgi:metal-responsive CopG/Arc/MetJ family transcriptional regulator